jgi:hypothetical protein
LFLGVAPRHERLLSGFDFISPPLALAICYCSIYRFLVSVFVGGWIVNLDGNLSAARERRSALNQNPQSGNDSPHPDSARRDIPSLTPGGYSFFYNKQFLGSLPFEFALRGDIYSSDKI